MFQRNYWNVPLSAEQKKRFIRLYREKPSILTSSFHIDQYGESLETGEQLLLMQESVLSEFYRIDGD